MTKKWSQRKRWGRVTISSQAGSGPPNRREDNRLHEPLVNGTTFTENHHHYTSHRSLPTEVRSRNMSHTQGQIDKDWVSPDPRETKDDTENRAPTILIVKKITPKHGGWQRHGGDVFWFRMAPATATVIRIRSVVPAPVVPCFSGKVSRGP